MSIFFAKMGYGRYTMSVVTPTFIIEPFLFALPRQEKGENAQLGRESCRQWGRISIFAIEMKVLAGLSGKIQEMQEEQAF